MTSQQQQVSAVTDEPHVAANVLQTKVDAQCDKLPKVELS